MYRQKLKDFDYSVYKNRYKIIFFYKGTQYTEESCFLEKYIEDIKFENTKKQLIIYLRDDCRSVRNIGLV